MIKDRYVIKAYATAQSVGDFVSEAAQGVPRPLSLEFEAIKRSHCTGSDCPHNHIDLRNLRPKKTHEVELTYKPPKFGSIRSEDEFWGEDVTRKLIVVGGSLAITGYLDMPQNDPFAQRVLGGFSINPLDLELVQQPTTIRTRREPPYIFLGQVFEAPVPTTTP